MRSAKQTGERPMSETWEHQKEEIFNYLLALRDSGAINMFGSSQYVMDEFGLTRREARDAVMAWMKSF
jgi:hypothetical protein